MINQNLSLKIERERERESKQLTKQLLFSLLFSSVLLFSGCGGGGGSSASSSSNTTTITDLTGQFIDSPVQGLEYTTTFKNGITNSNGEFLYIASDSNISFKLGNITIGDFNLSNINSDKKILPTDLAGVDRNNTTDIKVLKLIRFLQSLDDDGNPSNGINITSAVRTALVSNINILDANVTISNLDTIITNIGKTFVSEDSAKSYFESYLRDSFSLDVDTVAPNSPTLTTNILYTDSNQTDIEVNGEVGVKIYVNGIDTNQTIDATGKKIIFIDTIATNNNYNSFVITLIDSKDNISDSFDFNITKDGITPIFTTSSTLTMFEGNIVTYDINATDTNTIIYSISGGNDQSKFSINSSIGILSFITNPTFDTPTDSDTDNIYEVTISATDIAGNITTQTISITITKSLYIKSAIYDNNRTSSVDDDRLYLYLSKQVDTNTISSDMSANYTINGTGAIGSASLSDYNDTLFHRHKISLNSNGTASTEISTSGDTNLSITSNQITGIDGVFQQDFNQTTIQKFNPLGRLSTGQITCYDITDTYSYDGIDTINCADINALKDDGYYQSEYIGNRLVRNYTVLNGDSNQTRVVVDNSTGLVWQDNNDTYSLELNASEAENYCSSSNHAGYNNWRLPTIEELISIVNRGYKYPTIDPSFIYTNATPGHSVYWSSTVSGSGYNSNSDFRYGYYTNTYSLAHPRCVRETEEIPRSQEDTFFRDNTTEIVIDTSTLLMWQDNNDSINLDLDFNNAINYCENLVLSNYNDWHLPTFNELFTISDIRKSYNSVINNKFQYKPSSNSYYHTSTTYFSPRQFLIRYSTGWSGIRDKDESHKVRCVRYIKY